MARLPDFQAEAAYKWEDSFTKWAGGYMTPAQATRAINKAARLYGIPPPAVKFPTRNKKKRRKSQKKAARLPSTYSYSTHTITLRPRHMNLAVCLHETAHAITDYILGAHLEDHGRHWLSVYMNLLVHYKIQPELGLVATATAAKLEWVPLAETRPCALRRSFPKLAAEQRQRIRLGYTVSRMVGLS